MSQLFAKLRKSAVDNTVSQVMTHIQSALQGGAVLRAGLESIVSSPILGEAQQAELSTALEGYQGQFNRIGIELGMENIKESQKAAAAVAAVLSTNIKAAIAGDVFVHGQSDKSTTFVGMEGLGDSENARLVAFESYDERDNRNAALTTVSYNFMAGRQNPFGEMFFPTVTVAPDNVGVDVSIHLSQVIDDFKRDANGTLAKFNRKNLIRAIMDSTILKNDLTRVVPVHRAGSAANFVNNAIVAPAAVSLEGEAINTAPLAIGVEVDLLGLSQTDTLLGSGIMDVTDSLDTDVRLENVYLTFEDGADVDVIRVPMAARALNQFNASPQDNYKKQVLNFTDYTMTFDKDTKKNNGAALVALDGIATNDLQLVYTLVLSGSTNTETGTTVVYGNSIKLTRVINRVTGLDIPLGSAPAAAIATIFGTAKIVGYDVKAWRTNSNVRQRGQLLTTTIYNQRWAVPLRSPLATLRPVNADTQSDAADLATLVAGTFARTSNEAVTTLLATTGLLSETVKNRVAGSPVPEILGVARMLLEPTYIRENLDVQAVINSVQSHEKAADIQAVLAQKIRDIAFRLYRDSGIQAAIETQAGGISGNPTVLIGTDPMTARYLMVDGDTRLLGPDFKFQVETTSDVRMQGKIVIAFGYPEGSNGKLNPMHFGNMLWVPEMTLVLPISRNGQISKELIVQPRFRHIVNVPIMGMIEVEGIVDVVSTRTVIDFHEIP